MNHQTEKILFAGQRKYNVSYPHLLVDIGSRVSIVKVNGANCDFGRIGGSSLDGGTL